MGFNHPIVSRIKQISLTFQFVQPTYVYFCTYFQWNCHLKAQEKRAARATCGETFHNLAPYNARIRTTHHQPTTTAATRKRTAATSNDAPDAKRSKRSNQTSTSTASEPAPSKIPSLVQVGTEPDPVLNPSNLVASSEENIAQMYRNTGRKFEPDSADTTAYKTDIIFVYPPSTQPASENS